MDDVEQNIDAYRIVFEILNDLRSLLRRELERIHGRDWPRAILLRKPSIWPYLLPDFCDKIAKRLVLNFICC